MKMRRKSIMFLTLCVVLALLLYRRGVQDIADDLIFRIVRRSEQESVVYQHQDDFELSHDERVHDEKDGSR